MVILNTCKYLYTQLQGASNAESVSMSWCLHECEIHSWGLPSPETHRGPPCPCIHTNYPHLTTTCQFRTSLHTPHMELQESIPRLFNRGRTIMTTRCAPACSQVLPVKPQGVWARGVVTWSRSRDPPKSGVSEVGVFRAFQPNGLTVNYIISKTNVLEIP